MTNAIYLTTYFGKFKNDCNHSHKTRIEIPQRLPHITSKRNTHTHTLHMQGY